MTLFHSFYMVKQFLNQERGCRCRDRMAITTDVVSLNLDQGSFILWRSVLLVEETGGPGENHRPVSSH
jgi:hypothetical protein